MTRRHYSATLAVVSSIVYNQSWSTVTEHIQLHYSTVPRPSLRMVANDGASPVLVFAFWHSAVCMATLCPVKSQQSSTVQWRRWLSPLRAAVSMDLNVPSAKHSTLGDLTLLVARAWNSLLPATVRTIGSILTLWRSPKTLVLILVWLSPSLHCFMICDYLFQQNCFSESITRRSSFVKKIIILFMHAAEAGTEQLHINHNTN